MTRKEKIVKPKSPTRRAIALSTGVMPALAACASSPGASPPGAPTTGGSAPDESAGGSPGFERPATPTPVVVRRIAQRQILLADSLTHYRSPPEFQSVCVGASFAGVATASYPLKQGCLGWIAHAAGPGLDEAGISGLVASERLGVPAAAVDTLEAGLSNGASVLAAPLSHVNAPARALGVERGMSGLDAATLMLEASFTGPHDIDDEFDTTITRVMGDQRAGIYMAWSIGLVEQRRPRDVFCVASHGGAVMADYALPVAPRGIIANDAGLGLDRSGVRGVLTLDAHGIAAAAVGTDSARIGDPSSTYADGVLSVVNATARRKGVRKGMSAAQAARLMLL